MDAKKAFGVILIIIGVFALINNLELAEFSTQLVLGIAMLVIAAGLFSVYSRQEKNLWYLLVGLVLLFWGIAILAYEMRLISQYLSQQIFLLGLGFAFFVVYFKDTRRWWAVLPGGALFVIAIVHMLDELFYLHRGIPGFLQFLGFGLIFLYLYLIRDEQNRLGWAIYPSVVLCGLALFQLYFATHSESAQIAIGVLFIVLGFLLILFQRKNGAAKVQESETLATPPSTSQSEDASTESRNEDGDDEDRES